VGRLSVRISAVYPGTSQCQIVDSGGDLGVALVGRQVSAMKRPASFASAGLVFTGATFGASSKSKLIEINHTQ
jgi:hypothetical protein